MRKRKGLPIELINYCINSNASSVIPEVRTYATWNPADKGTRAVLSNGNLTLQPSLGGWAGARSTISKSSGKWYWEFVPNGVAGGGVTIGAGNTSATLEDYLGIDAGGWSLYGSGTKIHNNVQTPGYSAAINAGDTIGVLMNMDTGEISVRVNNVDTGVMFTGLTGNIFAMYNGLNNVGVSNGGVANFGATPFAYSVPSGYNAGLYDTVDLSAGLVAHYPLATNSLDTSGNGYNGTPYNMSFDGTSAIFNGTNGYIDGMPNLLAIPTFSVSCWLTVDQLNGVFRGVFETSANYAMVDYSGSGTVGVSTYSPIAGAYLQYVPNGVLAVATYYHVVLTFSGGIETAYRNGIAVGSVSRSIGTSYFVIGKSSYNDMYWKGKMKKFRIYNRVLNAGEIAALYAEGYVPPTSVSWNNGGGYIPEMQGASDTGLKLKGNNSFTGCTGVTIVSAGGGVCSTPTIDGSGQLVFNYTAPFVDPDTLQITGTDYNGNPISINFSVPLPF